MEDKNFVSIIKDRIEFESVIKDAISFASIIEDKKEFESLAKNFITPVSWSVAFRQTTSMSAEISSLRTKLSADIAVSPPVMTVSDSGISLRRGMNISFIQSLSMQVKMKLSQKWGNINIPITNTFTIVLKDYFKLGNASISVPTVSMSAELSARKYALVSSYDSYLLSDLDSMLLQDMDYTVV